MSEFLGKSIFSKSYNEVSKVGAKLQEITQSGHPD